MLTDPMPSLYYDGVKQNYQMVRNAMQIIKIASCAAKGLWTTLEWVVRKGYDLSDTKESATQW